MFDKQQMGYDVDIEGFMQVVYVEIRGLFLRVKYTSSEETSVQI